MKIVKFLFSLIERSRLCVSKNAMAKGFLANFFPIAYANLLYISLLTLDIVSKNIFNVKTLFLLFLSFLVIILYAMTAEIVYDSKKDMRIGMLINTVNNIIGAIGFGFVFQIF